MDITIIYSGNRSRNGNIIDDLSNDLTQGRKKIQDCQEHAKTDVKLEKKLTTNTPCTGTQHQ